VEKIVYRPVRRKLPDERRSITHKFTIGGHEGYIIVGMYEDGSPGEIFIANGQRGLDHFGPDGQLCDRDQLQLADRRAAEVPGGQVQSRAFEPSGFQGESDDSVCEVDHGLHFRCSREVPGPEYRWAKWGTQ